jgi:Mn2+/Fe2+ NRAMP family transporter
MKPQGRDTELLPARGEPLIGSEEDREDHYLAPVPSREAQAGKQTRGLKRYLSMLGPGLVAGASDNDPTTVAALAVLGASFGYGLSWLTILLFPMLATIQMIGAQVGVVGRRSLQRVVRDQYGRGWGMLLLLSVVSVNLVTIAADLEAGAAALGLLFHAAWQWFVIPFALAMLAMMTVGTYAHLQRALQVVLLIFAAYIFSAFAAHPDWGVVLHTTFFPPISLHSDYVKGALALLGTTVTAYVYVWETIGQAEQRPPMRALGAAKADAALGMLVAVGVFWFILIATGASLGAHHEQVQTAQQAAQALGPIAGPLAGDLFAVGLLASAILAVPVLAATTAYMLGGQFNWRRSLSERIGTARYFYAALAGVSPIQLLIWASIAGGIGTPVGLTFLLLTARDRRVMGDYPIGKVLTLIGWATTLLISVISVYFLYQQFWSMV